MRILATLLVAAAPGLATGATLPGPTASPSQGILLAQPLIQGAQFATGVLTAIDPDGRTITLGNETYYVSNNDNASRDYQPGQTVEVTYVLRSDGRREVLALRRTDNEPRRDRPGMLP
jgi:hypothetical protein